MACVVIYCPLFRYVRIVSGNLWILLNVDVKLPF